MTRVIEIAPYEQWAQNICGRCVDPGHCCTGFHLTGQDGHAPVFWDHDEERPSRPSLPTFVPVERLNQWTAQDGELGGLTYSSWVWRCTALGTDGRCTIYETRPELCRRYEPLEDGLCVMGRR